ncbi:hypothetical protein I5535_01225 [Rhodobacteraceae bacterium F11138]|nr:hypothetical protein [Rhodobacteraceae bacterium F11138]
MIRRSKKTRKPRIRSSALLVISILMIGSASMRIMLQAGPALARDSGVDEMQDPAPEPGRPDSQNLSTSEDFQALLAAFQQREAVLKSREKQVEDRMKTLEIAQKAIDERLTALKVAERQLSETLSLADSASEDDISALTIVYEKMKAKQSAALFEEMDPQFAAGFLARMKPEAAAEIMAGLSPMAAYSISVVLAGRNASVPTD